LRSYAIGYFGLNLFIFILFLVLDEGAVQCFCLNRCFVLFFLFWFLLALYSLFLVARRASSLHARLWHRHHLIYDAIGFLLVLITRLTDG
jgi:hypothetical protein